MKIKLIIKSKKQLKLCPINFSFNWIIWIDNSLIKYNKWSQKPYDFVVSKKKLKVKLEIETKLNEWMNEWMPFMGCKLSNQLLI